jgi:hypothetical protein
VAFVAVAMEGLRTRRSVSIGHRTTCEYDCESEGSERTGKIHSDDALGLVQYLRTTGYKAWIEDANGNVMEKTVLKNAIK